MEIGIRIAFSSTAHEYPFAPFQIECKEFCLLQQNYAYEIRKTN